jgi:DNA-binding PadR family transcriptional regulator
VLHKLLNDEERGRHRHHPDREQGPASFGGDVAGEGDAKRHGHHDEEKGGRGHAGGRHGEGRGGHEHGRLGGRGPRERAKRGESRYILLDALTDGAKHGYDIIKALEERSGGEYAPSPGTVYPTLQFLEDLGLVAAEQSGDRRVYTLTDAGRADLEAHADELRCFWDRFSKSDASSACRAEAGYVEDALAVLASTVWSGMRSLTEQDKSAGIRDIRRALQAVSDQVRDIVVASTGTA